METAFDIIKKYIKVERHSHLITAQANQIERWMEEYHQAKLKEQSVQPSALTEGLKEKMLVALSKYCNKPSPTAIDLLSSASACAKVADTWIEEYMTELLEKARK